AAARAAWRAARAAARAARRRGPAPSRARATRPARRRLRASGAAGDGCGRPCTGVSRPPSAVGMVAAAMSAPSPQTGCVIGVDLGGTKLLAGVVGPDLAVRHRVRRRAFGLDQATLMATIVEAVEEARAAVNEEIVS